MEKSERVSISISIDKELLKGIDEKAKELHISRASLIRKYCSERLREDNSRRAGEQK